MWGSSRSIYNVDNVLNATSTAPFSFRWSTSHIAAGSHTLRAVAHDAAGTTGASALVTVYK